MKFRLKHLIKTIRKKRLFFNFRDLITLMEKIP
jgi:hypothetical protein